MPVEDVIERYEGTPVRTRLKIAAGVVMLLVILGVGLNTIIAGFLKGPKTAGGHGKVPSTAASNTKILNDGKSKLATITEAKFDYLAPDPNIAWSVDEGSEVYDATKQVAKYNLKLTNAGTMVTISQQAMPSQLTPRDSPAFMEFVNGNKPTRSMDVGKGTLYFLPALQNGAAAAGADTVIYATDDVLLFGRAERVVGYDGWSKLMGAMKPN